MSLRFHEIAEGAHPILNPLSPEKLALLGELCQLAPGQRVLDLACGKGELLIQWARRYACRGVGVDISEVFIRAARQRAEMLEVLDQVTFVIDDAGQYPQPYHAFDVVSCLGATWIGGGLAGTLELMQTALADDGLILVGEPYWHSPPPPAACAAMNCAPDDFATLGGTLERFESAGLWLVEMVLADQDTWDRYEARQWINVDRYLRENRDDPEWDALRQWSAHNRYTYLNYGRQYMGWGVFVLRYPPA